MTSFWYPTWLAQPAALVPNSKLLDCPPHDIQIKDSTGAIVFKGDIFNGVDTRIYQVPALPAGDYTFSCVVHPNMTGTAKLQ